MNVKIVAKLIILLCFVIFILILFKFLNTVERYEIVEIDGCEYIQNNYGRDSELVHKENCKNH